MITHMGGGSEYVTVTGSYSNIPYVASNANIPMMGTLRVNGSNFEVYNGSTWMLIGGGQPIVDVSQKTKDILQWAEAKMSMEREIMKLIETNPTVADAYKTYQDAADKLEVVMKLTQE